MMTVLTHNNTYNQLMSNSSQYRTGLRIIGLSFLVVSLAACNTIPPIQTTPTVAQPNIPITSNYDVFPQDAVLPSSMAALRWQGFYDEPKLQALIAIGLDNNKDIQQSLIAIRKSQAQYQITDSNDLPKLNGSGGYSISANNAVDRNSSDGYSANLGLANYELDFWGKVSSLKDQALQNFLATTAAKDTAQVSLIANIAKSYVNLSYQLKQFELASKTFDTRAESLRITKARLDAGIDSKSPSLQAEASLETARIAMLNAKSSVQKAKNALQYLIGMPIPEELIPTPAVPNITAQEVLSPGLPSDLLRFRPDVLQAEYRLKAAGANIDVARAAYYPSISLTGRLGYSSSELSDLFSSDAAGWSFGPSISVPIFDAGQLDANYQVAQLERDQALLNYERAIETAFREVSDVLADRATLEERLDAQYRLQSTYDEIFNIADARYRAQVDNYLSVLDAQRSLFATQQSILNLELERLANQIELYQVLGGGANIIDPKPILLSQHTNLVDLITPQSNADRALEAIEAASSPIIITPEQALIIKAEQPSTFIESRIIDEVDVDTDPDPDAVIAQIKEVNIVPVISPKFELNTVETSAVLVPVNLDAPIQDTVGTDITDTDTISTDTIGRNTLNNELVNDDTETPVVILKQSDFKGSSFEENTTVPPTIKPSTTKPSDTKPSTIEPLAIDNLDADILNRETLDPDMVDDTNADDEASTSNVIITPIAE